MQIKSRLFLVALLIVCQAACLGTGVVWSTGWLWSNFERVVHKNVVAQGKSIAHDLALNMSTMDLESLEPGTADWERIQKLCEQTKIPHDGFVCVMRRDNGAMLCHPKLTEDPGLLRLFPGQSVLLSGEKSGRISQLVSETESTGERIVQGRVELDGDLHVLTTYSLKPLNAILAVYQSDYAVDAFVNALIRPVMQIGYALTAFIVGATAIVTVFLIKRYEAGIADANDRIESQVLDRTKSLLLTRNAIVFGLAKLSESRDRNTVEHLERMRSYVTILATEVAMTNPIIDHHFVANLAIASSLHDIGKVGIPDGVLLKPGPLTPDERRAMELHTVLGSECLSTVQKQVRKNDFLIMAQEIAIAHHEHWDGGGYPHGIQGKNIPLAARIVALADVYDAITSVRPYKDANTHCEARDWILSQSSRQFDPEVVSAFAAREQDFERIYLNKQDSIRATADIIAEPASETVAAEPSLI